MLGDLHILDEDMRPCAVKVHARHRVVQDRNALRVLQRSSKRTAEARSADGTMSTVGDVGYVDADNFLYLTDRKPPYMIISGGVNIYPQECENLLITHPKVADAAVFGVPNVDLGEEVKAVVQVMPRASRPMRRSPRNSSRSAQQHLSRQKCPRSIDFEAELPRLPTGKLYKRLLRDRYWGDKTIADRVRVVQVCRLRSGLAWCSGLAEWLSE
jgi:long-chain acyl-CoA synthetase